jgi:predicted regulator of Ras-like GTPase activity (Roadblock/LC7/MglB family)
VDPAFHAQDLDRLIADFTERVPEVVRALVVSSDGVPVVASGRMQPDHLEKLSVITSGLIGLSCGAVQAFDGGGFTQALVAMERGNFVIMAIDDGSSLAVLTTAAADLDQVAYEMTILVEQAGSIFTPPVRSAVADTGSPEATAAASPVRDRRGRPG